MSSFTDILNSIIEAISDQTFFVRLGIVGFLLVILVLFSLWQGLKMEKLFLASFARGFVQLLLMGSILIIIFGLERLWVLYLILLFIPKSIPSYPSMGRKLRGCRTTMR